MPSQLVSDSCSPSSMVLNRAATEIGDDTLQRASQGTVVPDSFTHGSAAQRSGWFRRGYEGGQLSACDTFGWGL